MFCSPARSLPQQSSSGDLLPEMMESETPPQDSSHNRADDFEVSSRRVSPDQQEVQRMMKTMPQGETSVVQGPRCMVTIRFTAGDDSRVGQTYPFKGVHTPTAASRGLEAPDTLMDMLRYSSVSEEHHTLMGTVAERIMSGRSGLNEAFTAC